MEKLFELTFQGQTLNPQVGTFTDASQTTGTFTLEDGEYYLTNADTKGFYAYAPIAIQPDSETDNKVTVEFDLKVVTASVNTHTIIGTYAGVDGSGIPTGAKITLQYNAGDIELVLGSGTTETLIAAADVVVDQWYHFRIDCALAPTESTYGVKIDGVLITTVTGVTTDYALGIISVLGTDLHACDECGIKNIRLITDDDYFVGRTALDQALQDVKGYVDTTKIPLAGSNQISGSLIPSTDGTVNLGGPSYQWNNAYIKSLTINGTACGDILTHNASEFVPRSGGTVINGTNLFRYDTAGHIEIGGGNTSSSGASITLSGSERLLDAGYATIKATDGTNITKFIIKPDGTVKHDFIDFNKSTTNSRMAISGGTGWLYGGTISLYGSTESSYAGCILLNTATSASNAHIMFIKPDGTWTWNGTACQITSDQRLKQQIAEIDDKLLDAWEDVNLVQFKYNDAVDQKGKDKARLHTGYVVQQIDKACKEHGVDVSAYGLFCHEEYPEETEEVEVEQKDGTKVKESKVIREASEHYSLRYTEVYAVECMYLRRCIARLTARIEQLEKEQEACK